MSISYLKDNYGYDNPSAAIAQEMVTLRRIKSNDSVVSNYPAKTTDSNEKTTRNNKSHHSEHLLCCEK